MILPPEAISGKPVAILHSFKQGGGIFSTLTIFVFAETDM